MEIGLYLTLYSGDQEDRALKFGKIRTKYIFGKRFRLRLEMAQGFPISL